LPAQKLLHRVLEMFILVAMEVFSECDKRERKKTEMGEKVFLWQKILVVMANLKCKLDIMRLAEWSII
jgi:hypothetical protein